MLPDGFVTYVPGLYRGLCRVRARNRSGLFRSIACKHEAPTSRQPVSSTTLHHVCR